MNTGEALLGTRPLRRLFACPLSDGVERQRWHLVNGLLLILLAILTLGDIVQFPSEGIVASLPAIATLGILFLANRRGHVDFASHALVWLSTLLVTAAWIQYAIDATNVISIPALYAIPILLATVLLGGRSVAAVTASGIALTLCLYLGIFPQTVAFHTMPEGISLGLLITTFTLLGGAGGLGWQANREIKRAMDALSERNARLEEEMAERRRAVTALRVSEQRYRSLFEHNQAGVLRTLVDGTIVACNAAMVQILGYDAAADLLGANMLDFFLDPVELQGLSERLRVERSVEGLEIALGRKDGSVVNALISASHMEDENAQPVFEGTVMDITALKKREAALETLSTHDPLTGLYNRRALNDIMAKVLRSCTGAGDYRDAAMALILIDIDHFKLVNDRYGHQVGDEVLQEVARRVSLAIREQDHVARYGGDEMAVLLPGASPADAWLVAERIRAAIACTPIQITNHTLPDTPDSALAPQCVQITISAGLACGPDDMGADQCKCKDVVATQDMFIAIADEGLYQAKNRGRNCVAATGKSAYLHSD